MRSPERAALLLVAGTLDRSGWPELEDEDFAADVGRRLSEVGLELVGAGGRWLARPRQAEEEEGFEPTFHLHSVELAMAAALYLHLRYLPQQAEAIEQNGDIEPSVEVDDLLSAFDGYDKLYLERMVLGHLRNAGFVRREGGRLYAGPYLAAINEVIGTAAHRRRSRASPSAATCAVVRRRSRRASMPQIEQVQAVWWGPLLADAVPLALEGINVATGPNGSGKTTFLDAIKLILNTELGRKPAEYIFDGGGEEAARRAERALVKAVFANPERGGRKGRVFADAGRGCEATPYVTAICEVTRDRRRYAILPGYVGWGESEESLEADIRATFADIPNSHWMGPTTWSNLLARAGVTKALHRVISVKQGETDKVIEGRPEELLRRMLELTGKQETLETFREAKRRLTEVRQRYEQTLAKFTSDKQHLAALEVQAARHAEYQERLARRERIEQLELPAARHAEGATQLEGLENERAGFARALERELEQLATLDEEIPALEAREGQLARELKRLRKQDTKARTELIRAGTTEGEVRSQLEAAKESITAGPEDVNAEAVAGLEREAQVRERAAGDAEEEKAALEQELADLRAGKPRRPPTLDQFRASLADHGIASELIAERLELPEPIAGEALLGDGVWALVIPPEQFEKAVELAVEQDYRLPLASAGDGQTTGALAGASGLEEALAYLAEIDQPVGAPGVSREGLVRGEYWAAWRAPDRPVLGERARQAQVARCEARLAELAATLPALHEQATTAREQARLAAEALTASGRIGELEEAHRRALDGLREAQERAEAIRDLLDAKAPESGALETTLERKRSDREELHRAITTERQPRLEAYDRQVAKLKQELAALVLSEEQAALTEFKPVAVLQDEHERLGQELADEQRFPEEVRGELVLAYRDAQARTVEEVELLLGERKGDLEAVEAEVDRARERYEQHIRQVVHLLGRRFRSICEQAGMAGEIELRPAPIEGEFGLEVKVAWAPSEPKRSYRSPAHSGGQRAKISILLLLAAIGLESAADLLILDEHTAHLDSRNIDDVAELMTALKDRVQFILAIPTNAEATRLGWCDHQLAFYPREEGEPYAPPIRLFTHQPEDGRKYAAMGQLELAD